MIVTLDARMTITMIVEYTCTRHADFVVLHNGDDLFAFRVYELNDTAYPARPAFEALSLESWKQSPRVRYPSESRPPLLADPTAPSSWRFVYVDTDGAPVDVEEPTAREKLLAGRDLKVVIAPEAYAYAYGGPPPMMRGAHRDGGLPGPSAAPPRADERARGEPPRMGIDPGVPRSDELDIGDESFEPDVDIVELVGDGAQVVRYPSINASGDQRTGATLLLRIDLTRAPCSATASDPVAFSGLPTDWRQFAVSVVVTSPQLELAGGNEGTILVRRQAASIACFIPAVVKPEGEQRIDVTAVFSRDDRWVGTAQRTLVGATAPVTPAAPPPAAAPARVPAPARASTTGAVHFAAGAIAPDLTIHIHRDTIDPERLHWLLVPAAQHRRIVNESLSGETRLRREPGAFVRSLFQLVAGTVPGEHVGVMRGIGEILWEATPPNVRAAYWKLHDALGDEMAIQFMTDEPWIPWELMRPVRHGTETRLLAEMHPVARGLFAYPDRVRPDLPAKGKRLTIAPHYRERTPPLPPLPHALDESAILRERFAATAVTPSTARSLLQVLEDAHDEPVQLLHFAGHGAAHSEAALSSIALDDRDLRVVQIRRPEVQLGERYKTFVIFNACEVGATGDGLGDVGGWAEAFAHRDFSGFMGPLWAVFDGHAKVAMEALLEALLERKQPVGRALRDVRRDYGDRSATFLSYVYYGDVNARFA